MKRLLVVLVLATIATAVAAAPAYAYQDLQGAGYATTAAQTAAASHASTVGAATTQGGAVQAVVIHGRGMAYGVVPATHAAAAAIVALLVLVVGAACFAILADQRRRGPAKSGSEPARFLSYKPASDQGREAA